MLGTVFLRVEGERIAYRINVCLVFALEHGDDEVHCEILNSCVKSNHCGIPNSCVIADHSASPLAMTGVCSKDLHTNVW